MSLKMPRGLGMMRVNACGPTQGVFGPPEVGWNEEEALRVPHEYGGHERPHWPPLTEKSRLAWTQTGTRKVGLRIGWNLENGLLNNGEGLCPFTVLQEKRSQTCVGGRKGSIEFNGFLIGGLCVLKTACGAVDISHADPSGSVV